MVLQVIMTFPSYLKGAMKKTSRFTVRSERSSEALEDLQGTLSSVVDLHDAELHGMVKGTHPCAKWYKYLY
jgi:hypothetical protein